MFGRNGRKRGEKNMKTALDLRESEQAKEATRIRLARIEAEMRVIVPDLTLKERKPDDR